MCGSPSFCSVCFMSTDVQVGAHILSLQHIVSEIQRGAQSSEVKKQWHLSLMPLRGWGAQERIRVLDRGDRTARYNPKTVACVETGGSDGARSTRRWFLKTKPGPILTPTTSILMIGLIPMNDSGSQSTKQPAAGPSGSRKVIGASNMKRLSRGVICLSALGFKKLNSWRNRMPAVFTQGQTGTFISYWDITRNQETRSNLDFCVWIRHPEPAMWPWQLSGVF